MSDLKLVSNFLATDPVAPEDADAIVLPVAYDKTSSWHKGADLGPQAILNASALLELHDSALDLDLDTAAYRVATLPVLTTSAMPDRLADLVERETASILARRALPVILGGEHSVSIGAVRAAAKHAPDLTVLQIDCHTDTRESYFGSTHSHACVMARAREVAMPIHVGIRSLHAEERAAIPEDRLFLAHDVLADEDAAVRRIADLLTPNVYVTIDVDGLDPALIPATGTPEPPGLSWSFVTRLLAAVAERSRIVGFDVVELCPRIGQHASDVAAARLVQLTMALALRARAAASA